MVQTKEQRKEYMKQYRENNKDKIAKQRSEYRERTKENRKEYSKQYRENNKEKQKEYRENRKEKIAKRKKEYRVKNRDVLTYRDQCKRVQQYKEDYETGTEVSFKKECKYFTFDLMALDPSIFSESRFI